jgi:hypothetical protein
LGQSIFCEIMALTIVLILIFIIEIVQACCWPHFTVLGKLSCFGVDRYV